jgi:acetyltransferase-like isoleucine patch superfamily enzyme
MNKYGTSILLLFLTLLNKCYRIILSAEYLVLKAKNVNIDPTVRFGVAYPGRLKILHSKKLRVGKHTVINPDSVLDCAGSISIGAYCHLGRGLTIYSTNHDFRSEEYIPYGKTNIIKPVIIEDFVWIGANVSICPGVTVGEGAVIGMGAVVTKDVEPLHIYGGNPAKLIGVRKAAEYYALKAARKFH